HLAANRNALARRRSTTCQCRCDRRAADLLPKPAGEGRDIAAREKLSRARVSPNENGGMTSVSSDHELDATERVPRIIWIRALFQAALCVRSRFANAIASDVTGW